MSKLTNGNITVLVGGQYGSEGKGLIANTIANEFDVHVRVGSPNAGHTHYLNGKKFVQQIIPCGWVNPNAFIVLGAGALIDIGLLDKEVETIQEIHDDFKGRLIIDTNSGILLQKHKEQEGGIYGGLHSSIGSTGEGVGSARIHRIQRDGTFELSKNYLRGTLYEGCLKNNTAQWLINMKNMGHRILLEGTQGSLLSLFHGYYPYVTSTDTNASGICAEVGIPPTMVDDIIMVVRTFPIRVAGSSGPMPDETTWEKVSEYAQKQIEEKTTVTKKVRRVSFFSIDEFKKAVALNGPTRIALTFCDYLIPELYGQVKMNAFLTLDEKFQKFYKQIKELEKIANCPVSFLGTGPETVVRRG